MTMTTIIPITPVADDIETKIATARAAIAVLLRAGRSISISFSAGKDSSVCLSLVLTTAAELADQGVKVPPLVLMHADTKIENPEIQRYAKDEMAAAKRFSLEHGFLLDVRAASPSLSSSWPMSVIGGRKLPSFSGVSRDCTSEFKIRPMTMLKNAVMKELGFSRKAAIQPINVIGTRYEESDERRRNMTERGETADRPWLGKDGYHYLSPIAYWEMADVWIYLGLARAGRIKTYSEFDETFRIYADAGSSSCAVVGDDATATMKSARACGARTGCSLCSVTEDKSMANLLATDPRYEYMKGLNRLQRFLMATRWDLSRRHWLGRTISKGWLTVQPDAYSPNMMEELLRYTLTIDKDERHAAARQGIGPRFQLITVAHLFGIDAMWSLNGHHRPFHALAIYKDVVVDGNRYDPPELETVKRPQRLPGPRYLHVGPDWDEGREHRYTGLRDPLFESLEGENCSYGTRVLAGGAEVLSVPTEPRFDVHEEWALFLLNEELDELLAEYHDNPRVKPLAALMHYLQLGIISVKGGSESMLDQMIKRTSWRQRHGLTGQIQDPEALHCKALSRAERETIAGPIAATDPELAQALAEELEDADQTVQSEELALAAAESPRRPLQRVLFP